MFEKRTVFVVGAGASCELGFPSGSELKDKIGRKLDIRYEDGLTQSHGDRRIVEAVNAILRGQDQRRNNAYFEAGRSISVGMPQAISIDNYLHAHSDDERIVLMGKLAIAAAILEAEEASTIAPRRDYPDDLDFRSIKRTWHTTFFEMLAEGVQRANVSGIFQNVSIITFNYDRCIEHYLAHSLRNYFRLELHEANKLAATLNIIHPYGQVGRLPWQATIGQVRFGAEPSHANLPATAGQIRTFTERVEDDDVMGRMRRMLAEAEVVVYLGFSYGDMNMQLMSIDQANCPRCVFGTSKGMSVSNAEIVRREIAESMGPDQAAVRTVDLDNLTCNEFLNDYWRPIMRGKGYRTLL